MRVAVVRKKCVDFRFTLFEKWIMWLYNVNNLWWYTISAKFMSSGRFNRLVRGMEVS